MTVATKPRLGQEPSAASLRATAETYERDAANKDESSTAGKAALPDLISNPDEMNRVSLAADADAREAIRLREMARTFRAALPAAEARERKAGLVEERARLVREGPRQAASWERKYSAAARVMAGVLAEMKENSEAVANFNTAAGEAGIATLWSAEFELRRADGKTFESLPDYVDLPSFALGAPKHWSAR